MTRMRDQEVQEAVTRSEFLREQSLAFARAMEAARDAAAAGDRDAQAKHLADALFASEAIAAAYGVLLLQWQ